MTLASRSDIDLEGPVLAGPDRSRARLELVDVAEAEPACSLEPVDVRMVTLDREGFLGRRRVLPAATKDCLRETFGVSETTWVKLRDGRPVKRVTLERLLARYWKIVESDLARSSMVAPGSSRFGRGVGDRP